jgi:hypothetical protein
MLLYVYEDGLCLNVCVCVSKQMYGCNMVIALSYNTVNIKWEAQTRDYGCVMSM